jgi:dienelactone hydrolase
MRRYWLWVAALAVVPAQAEVVTKAIDYRIGDTELASTLVFDAGSKSPRPGLVLIPNWMGASAAAIEKAKAIAGDDYVILVADVYGKDVRPKNNEEAGAAAKAAYADRAALRARVNAALAQLKAQAGAAPIDTARLGAIGFCFGGATALELARSGGDVAGVVSFHGNLSTSLPAQKGAVKASVLALNGADDSYVPAEQIAAFEKEMRDAGVDWQLVQLGGAVHCFAEFDQQSPPGCVYDERAAKRAYNMMNDFFAEVFAR